MNIDVDGMQIFALLLTEIHNRLAEMNIEKGCDSPYITVKRDDNDNFKFFFPMLNDTEQEKQEAE